MKSLYVPKDKGTWQFGDYIILVLQQISALQSGWAADLRSSHINLTGYSLCPSEINDCTQGVDLICAMLSPQSN